MRKLNIIPIFLLTASSALLLAETWSVYAYQLSGQGDSVRNRALTDIKAVPNLETELRAALSTELRYLALDVISALKLESFQVDLKARAFSDRDGAFLLTLNSLVQKEEIHRLSDFYRQELELGPSTASAPAKVILIDTLARLGTELPISVLEKLFDDPSFEVRSAVLHYVRFELISKRVPRLFHLLELGLAKKPYQVRLQTLFLIEDLPKTLRARARDLFRICEKDPHQAVQRKCSELKETL